MLKNNTAQGGQADPDVCVVAVDSTGGNPAPDEKRADLPVKEDADVAGAARLREPEEASRRTMLADADGLALRDADGVVPGGAEGPGIIKDTPHPSDVPDTIGGATERPPLAIEVGTLVAWAALACLLTLINRYAGFVVHLPPPGTVAGYLLALLYLAPVLLSLLQTARSAVILPFSSAFLFVAGAVMALPSLFVVFLTLTRMDLPQVTSFYNALPTPLQAVLNNFLSPIGLCMMGAAIGRVIRHPNTLLVAAGFAIFFDIIAVTMGTVRQLLQSGSNLIASVSVGAGAPAAALPGAPHHRLPEPISGVTIGPADVLFIALFLSSVHLLRRIWKEAPEGYVEHSWRESLYWMYGLLLLALVLVEVFGLPIPALVPMGVSILLANARLAAFTPTERRDLLIGGVFAIFCATMMIVWAKMTIPPAAPDLGIQLVQDRTGRVYIGRTRPGSPAERGGVREGDELQAVNGQSMQELVTAPQEFDQAVSRAPRNGLTLRIRHRGERAASDLRLGAELFRPAR